MPRHLPPGDEPSSVERYVWDPDLVSEQQRDAVLHPGNYFLTACPGSGKTRTVGVRLAYWSAIDDEELGRTRRIAATSYTNTAVREVTRAAAEAGGSYSDPHFVGTLHRFLMQYVVRPLGSNLMGCASTPRIVASPKGRKENDEKLPVKHRYTETNVSVWDLEWRADGSMTLPEIPFALREKVDPDVFVEQLQERAIAAKNALARKGLLSMSDALYWAMRVLEDEDLAQVVASRFDELIVDEVQDTSDVQQECIRRLSHGGIRSLVFVGDLDQAIYGFAHAHPEDVRSLVSDTVGQTSIPLSENYRSSQKLCDVASHFAGGREPDAAVGKYRDYGVSPEIIFYEEDDIQTAVAAFQDRLATLDIQQSDGVVLCRLTRTTDSLAGIASVALTGGLRDTVESVAAVRGSGTLDRDAIRNVENMVLSQVDPDGELDSLDSDERLKLRLGVMEVLDGLPPFETPAKRWAKAAREDLTALAATMVEDPSPLGARIRAPQGNGDRSIAEIAGDSNSGLRIRTIHSAKGESIGATLLVAVAGAVSVDWDSWLDGPESEEVRVAYVALTRAERFSALALPRSCPSTLVDRYLERGFTIG